MIACRCFTASAALSRRAACSPPAARWCSRKNFRRSNFWHDIVRQDCTLFQYIGELCRYLLKAPPSEYENRHRLRLVCGNGLRGDIWEAFQARFAIPRILEFYAATEGNFSLYNVEGKPGAIGRIPPLLAHRFPAATRQARSR